MKTDLIGVWSAGALFAPGSQEDEIIVFRSDGTGWIEWMNYAAHEVEFFSWMPTSFGWVVFSSDRRFERDAHNSRRYVEVEARCDSGFGHQPFSISEVETPIHGRIPQLELQLEGAMSGLYGLVQDDADSWSKPQMPT